MLQYNIGGLATSPVAEEAANFVIPSGARNLSAALANEKKERFLAPLGMTKGWTQRSRNQLSVGPCNAKFHSAMMALRILRVYSEHAD